MEINNYDRFLNCKENGTNKEFEIGCDECENFFDCYKLDCIFIKKDELENNE